jgi:hypothetical protein
LIAVGLVVSFVAGGLVMMAINARIDGTKRALKKKLYAAQNALFDIDGVIFTYIGQLDIVGQAMADKISKSITEFKRGMIK